MNFLSSITNKISQYIPSFRSSSVTSNVSVDIDSKNKYTKSQTSKNARKKRNKVDKNETKSTNKCKRVKKTIPKTIRNQVWRRFCGNKLDAKCFCCDQILTYECWEAGHVLSEANGGKTIVDNLRPICLSCNRSMGKMHMFDFMKRYQLSGVKNIK